MVLAVTMYGHKMGQAMTALMAEKERYVVELRKGHEKLAGKIREQKAKLQALLAAMKSIAEERLDTRVPVESFNHMAAELQKSKTNDQVQVAGLPRARGRGSSMT